ncbi:MAG TPA: THxN family PEP-CTERM protein [Pedomonas sp.]|uniref:THxN family PEP-CTERM protein n=1 Tax=Pedomonas sp. TaxID=2976421 RepID=UPI002F427A01
MQNVALKKLALGATAALGLTATVQTAEAALIESWTFTVASDWKNTSWSDDAGPNSYVPSQPNVVRDALPNGVDPNGAGKNYDILRWGTPATANGKSFLAVDNFLVNTALTNDLGGAAGSSVFHGNFKQHASQLYSYEKWLDATTLQATISITPDVPGGTELGSITRDFQIEFQETTNEVPAGTCPGDFDTSVTPCPDWFNISLVNASFEAQIGFEIYTFSLVFDLENSTTLRADFLGDSATVWTGENTLSHLATRVVVTSRVPEPGAIALLGAGLLGVGVATRRRRKA